MAEGAEEQIADLFAASESDDEGTLIGKLVGSLLSSAPHEDIYVFTAHDRGEIIAGAFFSRLVFANDPRSVFILSQMAVVTDRHGQGIGQTLQKQALARCVTTALLWR